MRNKSVISKIILTFVTLFIFSQTIYAFSDVDGLESEQAILFLKERGIVNGYNGSTFAPNKQITIAQGVTILVKSFDLNIDHLRFVKEPKVSDHYPNIQDDMWYSASFVNAFYNGVVLPKDINPNDPMSKELFADILFKAMTNKKDFAFIELWVMINDEEAISPEFMNSIQKMIISKINKLDEDRNFHPQKLLTRGEAAVMLANAIVFFEQYNNENSDVEIDVSTLTEDVNKVTVSWGEKSFGHSIKIEKIEFTTEDEAVISYQLNYPIPGEIYPQVMTYPEDSIFLSSNYTPTLKLVASGTTGDRNLVPEE